MRKKIEYFVALLLISAFIIAQGEKTAYAASAQIHITADREEITVGDTVGVYIEIQSDTAFGNFEANLIYDDEILEYTGKSSVISGSSGFLRIKDMQNDDEDFSRKYALEFKALKVGECKIAFQNSIMVYDYETGIEMAVSNTDININVAAPETASDNAYLANLEISPSTLDPSFDKNIFQYNTTVDYKTERLIVDASTEDEQAVVKVSGNDLLKAGENKVTVTVIAESGKVIEYIIDVIREEDTSQQEDPQGDSENGDDDQSDGLVEVIKEGEEQYILFLGKYKLTEPGADVQIPKGYVKTRNIISDVSIEVYVPQGNIESDFFLIYAENDRGELGFYRYDRIEKTIQRYIEENNTDTPNPAEEQSKKAGDEYGAKWIKIFGIIVLIIILIAAAVVLIMRFLSKDEKKRNKRKKSKR